MYRILSRNVMISVNYFEFIWWFVPCKAMF